MKYNENTVDMTEMLRRGLGELLYDGPEGAVVRRNGRGTVATDITQPEALLDVLRRLDVPELRQLTVKSQAAYDALSRALGLTESCPCAQWVYSEKEAPSVPDADIRLLTADYARTAAEHYHLVEESLPYIRSRIEAGQVWGIFDGGKLAGFIGTHSEGAMGMLEIFPEFRRRGYGYTLEAYLIAWHLAQGWTPYCHVVEGNDASTRLQRRLGMKCAQLPALWIS